MRGLGELEYLLGDYDAAESVLQRAVEESGRRVDLRVDAEVALALVYLQTNRYAQARGLFAGIEGIELPIWELMKAFGDEPPYSSDWGGATEAALPFVQTTTWELPCVRIEVNGLEVDARIDTGGELLTLSPDVPPPSVSGRWRLPRGSLPQAPGVRSATGVSRRCASGR